MGEEPRKLDADSAFGELPARKGRWGRNKADCDKAIESGRGQVQCPEDFQEGEILS